MVALGSAGDGVPLKVQAALEEALEAVARERSGGAGPGGRLPRRVGIDGLAGDRLPQGRLVEGALHRCRGPGRGGDAAANREAAVLPFEQAVVPLKLDPFARVAANAAKLAAIGGGGTNVSAPLAMLNAERAAVDLVVIVSDNQSWVDAGAQRRHGDDAEWEKLKRRVPAAKLVCIDLQPYGTTQAQGRADILNVGGFSDAVFETLARFASGETRGTGSPKSNETEVWNERSAVANARQRTCRRTAVKCLPRVAGSNPAGAERRRSSAVRAGTSFHNLVAANGTHERMQGRGECRPDYMDARRFDPSPHARAGRRPADPRRRATDASRRMPAGLHGPPKAGSNPPSTVVAAEAAANAGGTTWLSRRTVQSSSSARESSQCLATDGAGSDSE